MARLPRFKSIKEAAEFWDTHDTTEYFEDMDDVELSVGREKGQSLSPRCIHCGSMLLSRRIDLDVLDGRITLHDLCQLYCAKCGKTQELAPEAEALVEAVTAASEKVQSDLMAA